MYLKYIVLLVNIVVLAICSALAWAHGPVDRIPEPTSEYARLFVADGASGNLIAIDLPDGNEVGRLTTPAYIMSLALTADERHLMVMRGRDTDRDMITVINTGLDVEARKLRPPYVARTIPVDTPGPGEKNHLQRAGDKDALLMEGPGEMLIFEDHNFAGLGPVNVRKYKLGAPDHYFYLESGEHIYIGHLRKGYIQVLRHDTGEEVTKIPGCPVVHGKAIDPETGRLFYSCMRDVMVVGSRGDEMNQVVARISYPEQQRIGAFLKGKDRILWGYTEGTLPIIYRFDTSVEPYEFTVVPLGASLWQRATKGGEYLLIVTKGGVLQIRDGYSGDLLRSAEISGPFLGDYHEDVNKAVLPDIETLDNKAYVSLPHEGRVAVVDLATAEVEKYFETGGRPVRMSLVAVPRKAEKAVSN